MAESTLRQNRHEGVDRNPRVLDPIGYFPTTRSQAHMTVLFQGPIHRRDSLDSGAPLDRVAGQGEPGDTWIIDANRPYDPYDPGPYGSHGWYQDERTGRHRRGETPDPLPAENRTPPANAWYPGADVEDEAPQAVSHSGERSGPTPRGGRPVPGHGGEEVPRDRARPAPWGTRAPQVEEAESSRERGYRFAPLREAAMDRFMLYSAELHASHFQPERLYFRERVALLARWCLWVLALGLIVPPQTFGAQQEPRQRTVPISVPRAEPTAAQGRAHVPQAVAPSLDSDRIALPGPDSRMAAALGGARAARKVIAARANREHADLADTVRASAGHWRETPRPAPFPSIAAWELAFDTGRAAFGFGGAA